MAPMVINMRSDSQVEDRQIVTQLLQKQQDKIQKKKKKRKEKKLNEMDISWKKLCSPQSKIHIPQPDYRLFRGLGWCRVNNDLPAINPRKKERPQCSAPGHIPGPCCEG